MDSRSNGYGLESLGEGPKGQPCSKRQTKMSCFMCVCERDFEGFDDWMITTPQILEECRTSRVGCVSIVLSEYREACNIV